MVSEQETAVYVFRKLAYLLYLEIGALQPRVHPELARKARLKTAYFQRDKTRQALELYRISERETEPEKILAPYIERTGLTLEDVHRAFVEGDWSNKFSEFNFGGPKWERVADAALQLRQAIERNDLAQMQEVIQIVKGLKTNQGFIVNQFDRTDRRGR